MIKNKEYSRWVLLIFLCTFSSLIHFGKIPIFYQHVAVSQEIFSLILLLCMMFAVKKIGYTLINVNFVHFFFLVLFVFVVIGNVTAPLTLAVLSLYLLCLVLLVQFFDTNKITLYISFISVLAALLSLYEYCCFTLNQQGLLSYVVYLIGLKDSISHFGIYGQINLLACLLIVGLFAYAHLLYIHKLSNAISFVPISVISLTLFLTRCRSGLLALVIASLSLFYLFYRRGITKYEVKLLTRLAVAIIVGYCGAAILGATSIDKLVSSSMYSSGDMSSYVRFNLWASALWIGYDHLWTGAGIGSFKTLLPDYARPVAEKLHIGYDTISQTLWAHNDFLHMFAEHGIVFAVISIAIFVIIVRSCLQNLTDDRVFYLPAFLGFLVFSMFGHPLRYHATAFVFVCCLAVLIKDMPPIIKIKPKIYWPIIVVLFVFVWSVLIPQFITNYRLNNIIKQYSQNNGFTLSEYKRIDTQVLIPAEKTSIYTWRFKHELYARLVGKIIKEFDGEFAAYLLPRVIEYSKVNHFASIALLRAKLLYVLKDYKQAMAAANEATSKDPLNDRYSNFAHISHVMYVSHLNHLRVKDLFGADIYNELLDKGLLNSCQIDKQGIAI